MAQDTEGDRGGSTKDVAALELAKQIGVCYGTAWLILHKLRRAVRDRTQLYALKGLVEVDDGGRRRSSDGYARTGSKEENADGRSRRVG